MRINGPVAGEQETQPLHLLNGHLGGFIFIRKRLFFPPRVLSEETALVQKKSSGGCLFSVVVGEQQIPLATCRVASSLFKGDEEPMRQMVLQIL